MFERNRIDSPSRQQQMTVPVELTLEDGELIRGKFIVAASKTLFEVLDISGAFIEFEPYGGERSILAKSAVKALRLVNAPSPQHLNARAREIDNIDPFAILGIARGAGIDEARQAYHQLAIIYHRDRYCGIELTAELSDYLAGMAQRINAAYAALEQPAQVRKSAAQMAQPIYTSAPRA